MIILKCYNVFFKEKLLFSENFKTTFLFLFSEKNLISENLYENL